MVPRLFEINDQPWFPQFLREKVQDDLTALWTFRVPILQKTSPARLVSSTIARVLGDDTTSYTFVDFAAGAGGPTPSIERELNQQLQAEKRRPVNFLLTDLRPHVEAWKAAAKKSHFLDYVSESVDASNAPEALHTQSRKDKKVFRMYNLAFHHFPDKLAVRILEDSVRTSDGFGIFELQSRSFTSFLMIFLMGPLLILITPIFFWSSPVHLLFTYLIPIIPAVVVFDGYVSSLRTRSSEEIKGLLSSGSELHEWKVLSGKDVHTYGMGYLTWFICIKEKA